MARFQTRRTPTAGKVFAPSELLEGELGLNMPDKKLYAKDDKGVVFQVAGAPGRGIGKVLQYENFDGLPALITDDRILVTKSAVSANDYSILHVLRDANFSGGAEGSVNGAILTGVTVRAGVTSYEWGLQALLTNFSTTGQHCAAYSQANSEADGYAWAHVFEHRDNTSNPTRAKVTVEANINANGPDPSDQRRVVDVVLHKLDKTGADVIASRAVSIGTGSGAYFVSGYCIDANAQKAVAIAGTHIVGVDTTGARISGDAIRLEAGQTIALEATGSIKMRYNATTRAVELLNGSIVKHAFAM